MKEQYFYNTLKRRREPLRPQRKGELRLYVCGITVYDYCHLGHARSFTAFDVAVRWLRHRGLRVEYVRNITDVDDKILHRAEQEGVPYEELTERFIHAMHEDERALGLLPPDHQPRATEWITEMTAMIATLVERGFAYATASGDVYFSVEKFPNYGQLSGRRPDELLAGARVAPGEEKRAAGDFCLWKHAEPSAVGWDSPWGRGRPGWHIECSAMAVGCLGKDFDIHGGGIDLLFPHHENEIAQAQAACDGSFAHAWMHAGMVQTGTEKMSKSLGNFHTIRDLLAKHHPETLRWFLVSRHYRSPLQYNEAALKESHQALEHLYLVLRDHSGGNPQAPHCTPERQRFEEAMCDDFHTPRALEALFALATRARQTESTSPQQAADCTATLKHLANTLGLLKHPPEQFLRHGLEHLKESPQWPPERIEQTILQRTQARKEGNYTQADTLRKTLEAQGILLEDTPTTTHWRRKSG